MNLTETINEITPPDQWATQNAQQRWASIAKPLGSLGVLEEAMVQIAGITGSTRLCLDKAAVVVMCADNGVVAEGVTQTGQEVTAVVTENFAKGETSVCKMAKLAGATVIPVDIGVNAIIHEPGVFNRKIRYGTANMAVEPAMRYDEAVKAIEVGIELAVRCKEEGYQILCTGEMGIGNTTTSSALAAVLLNFPVETVTGRGAGLSDEGLSRKIKAIHRAITCNKPDRNDPIDCLAKVGGLDIAGLVGVFLGAAANQIPVLIDGLISAVAALVAVRICPDARYAMLASHISKEPAAVKIIEELKVSPFLSCGMSLGEGTGAVAALPILRMACAVFTKMSTFTDIAIEPYQPLV